MDNVYVKLDILKKVIIKYVNVMFIFYLECSNGCINCTDLSNCT